MCMLFETYVVYMSCTLLSGHLSGVHICEQFRCSSFLVAEEEHTACCEKEGHVSVFSILRLRRGWISSVHVTLALLHPSSTLQSWCAPSGWDPGSRERVTLPPYCSLCSYLLPISIVKIIQDFFVASRAGVELVWVYM